jgi:hypothetical protein
MAIACALDSVEYFHVVNVEGCKVLMPERSPVTLTAQPIYPKKR